MRLARLGPVGTLEGRRAVYLYEFLARETPALVFALRVALPVPERTPGRLLARPFVGAIAE
jgi:hypothetical protein